MTFGCKGCSGLYGEKSFSNRLFEVGKVEKYLVRKLLIKPGMKKAALILLIVLAAMVADEAVAPAVNRQDARYRLQVARYREEQRAIELSRAIIGRGHESSYEKVTIEGKGVRYRVYLGWYQDRDAAGEAGRALIKAGVVEHFMVRGPGEVETAGSPAVERDAKVKDLSTAPVPTEKTETIETVSQTEKKTADEQRKPPADKPAPASQAAALTPDPLFDSALRSFQAGRYEEALAGFRKVLDPGTADGVRQENALRYIADCLFFLGQKGDSRNLLQAVDRYKEILVKYPEVKEENAAATYRLAKTYVHLKFYYEAKREFENLRSRYPGSAYVPEALFMAGEMACRTRRFADAVEPLKEYVEKFPGGDYAKAAHFALADAYSQLQQMENAERWYRDALKKWSDWELIPADIMLNIGYHHFRNKNYADAAEMFFLHVNLFPESENNRDVFYVLARCLLEQHQYVSALKMFSHLIEQYPDSRQGWESAVIMANLGVRQPGFRLPIFMPGAAYYRNPIEAYNVMLKKFPYGDMTEGLLFQRGYALLKAGRFKDAYYTYLFMINQFPQGRYRAEGINHLALCADQVIRDAYSLGDHLLVSEVYFKTYGRGNVQSQDSRILFMMGESLKKTGLESEALKVLEKLANDGDPLQRNRILVEIADCHHRRGNDEAAEKMLAGVLGSKNLDAAAAALARRISGDIHYKKGLYDKAADLYADALKGKENLFEDRAVVYRNYAVALWQGKAYGSARVQFQNAVAGVNENPKRYPPDVLFDALIGLGECLAYEGNAKDAVPLFKQAYNSLPGMENPWALLDMARAYVRVDNQALADQTLQSLREKGGEGFWSRVADYTAREDGWLSKYGPYVK